MVACGKLLSASARSFKLERFELRMGSTLTSSDKEPSDIDIEVFKMVEDHFKQDVREFWTRANFYLLIQIGLFSLFAVTYSTLTVNLMALLIAILGFVMALFWFLVLRGSIRWLRRWRDEVVRLDEELDRFKSYSRVEGLAKERPFSSPSNLTQFLPIIFAALWLVLVVLEFQALISG